MGGTVAGPCVLGIDLGTTTCRANVFDRRGRLVSGAAEELTARYPKPSWAEVDPEVWWEGVARVVRRALAGEGGSAAGAGGAGGANRGGAGGRAGRAIDPREVVGVGLTGLMHAPVLVDGEGRPATPAMLWMDQRCAPQCEALTRELASEGVGGQSFSTTLTAPKLRWLADEHPDVLRRAAHLLLPKDFLRFRLTGEAATDATDAGGTGMFDGTRGQWGAWDESIVDLTGTPRRLLPPVRPAWARAGAVTPWAADATGLAPGTPVAVGGADTYCTRLGVGGLAPGEVCIYLGTAAWVAITAGASANGQGIVRGFGATATTGAALRWARDLLAPRGDVTAPPPERTGHAPGDRPPAPLSPSESYDAITRGAARVPPGADGLFFLPHLMGERGPRPDPLARGALVGLTLRHGRDEVVRAVLEGTAFQIRRLLEERDGSGIDLEGGPGRAGAPVGDGALTGAVVCGGGAHSGLWLRLLADVTGLPLRIPAAVEAGVLGAAMLGGVAAGAYTLDEARGAMIGPARAVSPDGAATARYGALFRRFRHLDDLLTPWFHESAEEPER